MGPERIPSAYAALAADYEIVRELGRGGTALVYLARERATGEDVAIKVIRAKYLEDDEALARFDREARFVAHLDHPNVVPVRAVLDLGAAGMALVMAHITGRTLKQVIREEHPMSPERVERIVRGIANGLGAAHAMGIVHRDVKPENIFIDSDGRALLADFGLARSMSGDAQLTMAGVAIGTPAYMAPEQIDGGQLDARGDIYSLGLVAWEMLTGHRPWEGESLYAILYHQKYDQLPDVRDIRGDVPDRLGDAIAGAIEKEPAARWQSVNDLIAALDGQAGTKRARRRTPVTSDTIRFARPVLAPPTTTPVSLEISKPTPRSVHAAALAEVATELEAAEVAPSRMPRRRFVVAGGALAAVAVIVLVATARQGRSNDRPRPQDVMMPTAAAGDVGQTPTAGNRRDSTRQAADTLATASNFMPGTTASPVSKKAESKPDTSSGSKPSSRDAAVPISQPNATVKAVAPPARPARSTNEPVSVSASTTKTGSPSNSEAKTSAKTPATTNEAAATPAGSPASAPATPPANSAPAPSPTVARPSAARATIVAGGMHSCLVSADGRAFCWGGNDHGQLGTGAAARATAPAIVTGEQRFTSLAAGLSHSCGITRDGVAWCWGENDHGQLGDRSSTPRNAPVRVAEAHTFRTIAAGAAHSCGLDSSGVAWCWGSNASGQLGDSLTRDSSVPVPVAGARRFTTLTAGWNFTCGLDTDAHAFCWGEDDAGELGDNATGADRRVPVPVAGGLSFASIAAGNSHACGVTTSGDAYCWGRNSSGQLGDGTTSDHSTPVRVKSSVRFVSITTGGVHTCAVSTDADAYCWGRNTYGQLGDGGTTDHAQPVRVGGAHAFATVRAFGSHTCGATVSGEAFCWGYNLDGQLGDGTRTHRTRPVYIEPPSGSD